MPDTNSQDPAEVLAYIEQHPGALTHDVATTIGKPHQATKAWLYRLQKNGKIHYTTKGKDQRARWYIGPAEDYVPKAPPVSTEGLPRQKSVKRWDAPAVEPQSWCSIVLNGATPEVK